MNMAHRAAPTSEAGKDRRTKYDVLVSDLTVLQVVMNDIE